MRVCLPTCLLWSDYSQFERKSTENNNEQQHFWIFFKINKRNCQPFEFSLNKITSSQLSRVAAKIEKDKQTLDGRTRVRQQRRTIDWSNILCVATWRICGSAAPTDPRVLIFPVKCGSIGFCRHAESEKNFGKLIH